MQSRALVAIALFFVLVGSAGAARMADELLQGIPYFDVNVLGFWIGVGLLRYRTRALFWARASACLGLLFGVVLVGLSPAIEQSVELALGDWIVKGVAPLAALAIGVGLTVFFGWQLHVLNRPDVRVRFGEPAP